jgi:hypothetical protein
LPAPAGTIAGMSDVPLHGDWFSSGWDRLLPPQALGLALLVSAASEGIGAHTPEGVLRELFGSRWRMLDGDLDTAVWWTYPGEENNPAQVAADDERRAVFEDVLARAGIPVPGTARDLLALFVRWGIASVDVHGQRWSTPEELPRPEHVLPVPNEVLVRMERARAEEEANIAATALDDHLTREKRGPRPRYRGRRDGVDVDRTPGPSRRTAHRHGTDGPGSSGRGTVRAAASQRRDRAGKPTIGRGPRPFPHDLRR